MNKYQEALNRIKTAPGFMGGTDLYKTHLNSSEPFLQDIATLQELVDKATPQTVIPKWKEGYDPELYSPDSLYCPRCDRKLRLDQFYKWCPDCNQKLNRYISKWELENE